ncbi:MAG: hypothetical protein K2Q13_05590 [Nitrosomonas sp.]|uniref:hypothetical protein n=1 Tax=Nitrosomonas sp. TaxID=42353 RepID=UPI0025D42458|nr:hypothetical protein [Nitrosomonas sp.]MBY0474524.1 hypothetical protein [Nitrosomonas sp.]
MINNIVNIDAFITEKEMILQAEERSLAEKIALMKELVVREIEIMIKSINAK